LQGGVPSPLVAQIVSHVTLDLPDSGGSVQNVISQGEFQ
jgi:hypothetical protein